MAETIRPEMATNMAQLMAITHPMGVVPRCV